MAGKIGVAKQLAHRRGGDPRVVIGLNVDLGP
jgi:hypothetical protein